MPIYEYECDDVSCQHVFEQILRIAECATPQPCPKCHGTTHRIMLPSGLHADACNIDPVVVYRNADGSFSMPGRTNAPMRPGQTRVELRNLREIDRFEHDENQRQQSIINRRVDHEQARYEFAQSARRSSLRDAMRTMSEAGKDFARAAMKRGDERAPRHQYEPGFHLEIAHTDQSNRNAWRDRDTGWRPRHK